MAHKLKSNHYVATHRSGVDSPSSGAYLHRASSREENDSHRAPSERTLSEYTTMDERARSPSRSDRHARRHPNAADSASDVYVTSGAYRPPSDISRQSRAPRSHYSYRSGVAPSVASTHRSKVSRKAGMKVEAMAAPNPFCPNVKGMCCLMLLLNLGLILVTLGFVIVLQFYEPLFVWILGIVFLVFGFITLVGSLIYCVVLCRENPYPRYPDDFYWTHHWSKTIGPSEIHYSSSEKPYRQNGHSDRYNKYNGKYSDRESAKGYSDRESKLSRY
ncbi:uncharacterized protein LOC126966417 [Leptidea sinapis]|uniref:Uncharacterized protein n=1 Tax=Leptidea sinapis TaxID=189913 RepID=A0A5E4QHZ0_9NEOP|nr:uncharacterized protein LOC126966417 [Leptidea sinapis]XP_050666401.1 uncharacterized protein LOC126966417 [Leptidea sinapis]XP_050666402.1 uncharacterized protein LOC126966417 [Leptidea sinapis]XP_050666403.1 uncharacterized protein LOC126966417 [Leptidea sinapis]XP_050666405.1 uncharacterized protein LOC126966417 [Leptidea sinapis]XP_050666406.1 uncharacterized protein LOC126966417 [Leptidea sinapis]VVC97113.1 unnamed protein product [Leptidea sinapis]